MMGKWKGKARTRLVDVFLSTRRKARAQRCSAQIECNVAEKGRQNGRNGQGNAKRGAVNAQEGADRYILASLAPYMVVRLEGARTADSSSVLVRVQLICRSLSAFHRHDVKQTARRCSRTESVRFAGCVPLQRDGWSKNNMQRGAGGPCGQRRFAGSTNHKPRVPDSPPVGLLGMTAGLKFCSLLSAAAMHLPP